jgi:hypothetical protein
MDNPFISAPFLMRTSMRVDHDVISFLFLCLKYAVRVGSLTDCERLWSGINLRSKLPLSDERSRFRSPKMKSSSDRSMFWMKFLRIQCIICYWRLVVYTWIWNWGSDHSLIDVSEGAQSQSQFVILGSCIIFYKNEETSSISVSITSMNIVKLVLENC